MALYKNNTGGVSKIGYLAKHDPNDPKAFVYAVLGDTDIIGIITQSVQRFAQCEIAIEGKTRVYCSEAVPKNATIRAGKVTDRISAGTCKIAKPTDTPFFRIGTALESGKGLILTQLSISNSALPQGYVPYLGAIQDVDLGSYDITATDVTAEGTTHLGGGTDYIEVDSDGNMEFVGDATVWDDMRITPGSFDRPGASDPTFVLYYPNGGGLGTYLPEFAKNNIASFTIQLPHSYKEGSDIFAHLHWCPRDRGVAESGNTVGWKVDYSWANHDSSFPDMQTADLSDACDGVNHRHQKTPFVQITGTSKQISSMLICNVRRSDTGTDDTWAGTISGQLPLLLEIDFHFPLNSVGSKTHTSK